MTEHRINCTSAETRSYQAGERVMRRKINPQPNTMHDGEPYWFIGGYRAWRWTGTEDVLRMGIGSEALVCPFGQPCDRLLLTQRHYSGVDPEATVTVRTVRVEQIDGVWWWVAEVEPIK